MPSCELGAPRSNELGWLGKSERDEQQARLVDVGVVAVNHDDLRRVAIEGAAQPVGHDGSTGAATEDHDAMTHT